MSLKNSILNKNIRKASSLILLRPSFNEYEVLMLKRPNKGTFKLMTVFPGGAVDKADSCQSLNLLKSKNLIKEKPNQLTEFKLSSIRETFEETGILLTKNQPKITDNELIKWRLEISNNAQKFIEFLNHHELIPAIDELYPVGRWITPEYMKRRFDTVFFAHSLLSASQSATINQAGHLEATQLDWETPSNWLNLQAKEVDFMPPQFYFCSLLNNYLPELDQLKSHLKDSTSSKSDGYLPNHIDIDTTSVNLEKHDINLPKDYKLFYTVLPGDKDYNNITNGGMIKFNENEKLEGNYHRVLGIRNNEGNMKMIKFLVNLPLKDNKFEFY